MEQKNIEERAIAIDILMVFLALASIFLLVLDVAAGLSPGERQWIGHVDVGIAFVFLFEFIYNFSRARNKKLFWRKYWWELFAAIPITTGMTQSLRALRIARVVPLVEGLRLLRLVVRLRFLAELSTRFTRQTYLIYVGTVVGVLLSMGALGFHYFEFGVNPRVGNMGDSFWWAAVTMTTTGYGDIYPITVGGRLVAVCMMILGLGTLSVFVALVDTYLIKSYIFKEFHQHER